MELLWNPNLKQHCVLTHFTYIRPTYKARINIAYCCMLLHTTQACVFTRDVMVLMNKMHRQDLLCKPVHGLPFKYTKVGYTKEW